VVPCPWVEKRPWGEVEHSPPSNAEVMKEWSSTCTHLMRLGGGDRDKCTFLTSATVDLYYVHWNFVAPIHKSIWCHNVDHQCHNNFESRMLYSRTHSVACNKFRGNFCTSQDVYLFQIWDSMVYLHTAKVLLGHKQRTTYRLKVHAVCFTGIYL
jgi:hypothetical protein